MDLPLKCIGYVKFVPMRGDTVAHSYAGILGPLAMFAALARGLVHGTSTESMVMTAWICLVVFAVIGGIVGALGGWVVEQSVRATVASEIENLEQGNKATGHAGNLRTTSAT